jgi:hypothetical protein
MRDREERERCRIERERERERERVDILLYTPRYLAWYHNSNSFFES